MKLFEIKVKFETRTECYLCKAETIDDAKQQLVENLHLDERDIVACKLLPYAELIGDTDENDGNMFFAIKIEYYDKNKLKKINYLVAALALESAIRKFNEYAQLNLPTIYYDYNAVKLLKYEELIKG